jgi:hypothetical protein
VVHAINAAIAKLSRQPVPAPFRIKDDKEAILLLAHFVGDIHQPLHVGATYLDAQGHAMVPASEADARVHETRGGNSIKINAGNEDLHHD